MKARKKGRGKIECQKSFDSVSIDSLVGGIEHPESRPTRGDLQRLRVFIASSGELSAERERVELLVGRENRRLHHKNLFIELVIWEDLVHSFHGDRIQDYFNEVMLECDVVVCMFFKKVGKFTKEEFDLAYRGFRENRQPRYLYVYFRSGDVKLQEIDAGIVDVLAMREQVEEAEQIYGTFETADELELKLKRQLDLVVEETLRVAGAGDPTRGPSGGGVA